MSLGLVIVFVTLVLFVFTNLSTARVYASYIQAVITCNLLPALTGDTTTSVGSCTTTTGKINGGAFSGTNGDIVGFGATNMPVDSGIPYNPSCGGPGLCVTGTLSQAQILTLTSTVGITLVSGQGANSVIVVDMLEMNLIAGGTVYAGSTADLELFYTAPNSAVVSTGVCSTAVIKSSTNASCLNFPVAVNVIASSSVISQFRLGRTT